MENREHCECVVAKVDERGRIIGFFCGMKRPGAWYKNRGLSRIICLNDAKKANVYANRHNAARTAYKLNDLEDTDAWKAFDDEGEEIKEVYEPSNTYCALKTRSRRGYRATKM